MAEQADGADPAAVTTPDDPAVTTVDDAAKTAESAVDDAVHTLRTSVDDAVGTAEAEIEDAVKTVEGTVKPEQVTETVKKLIEEVEESLTQVKDAVVGFDALSAIQNVESLIKGSHQVVGESTEPATTDPEETEKERSLDAEENPPPAAGGRSPLANCCGLLELLRANR